jgi:hypothetical protein
MKAALIERMPRLRLGKGNRTSAFGDAGDGGDHAGT